MSLLRDQMGEAEMKWGICQNNVSMEPEGQICRMLSCKLDDNVKFITIIRPINVFVTLQIVISISSYALCP